MKRKTSRLGSTIFIPNDGCLFLKRHRKTKAKLHRKRNFKESMPWGRGNTEKLLSEISMRTGEKVNRESLDMWYGTKTHIIVPCLSRRYFLKKLWWTWHLESCTELCLITEAWCTPEEDLHGNSKWGNTSQFYQGIAALGTKTPKSHNKCINKETTTKKTPNSNKQKPLAPKKIQD